MAMNFYPAVLIPLAIFTPLFYLNWNRIDKLVDESLFARFLLFGLLLGVLYAVLFLYSFFSIYRYVDLMLFSLLLFLPMLSAGEQLSMVTGKYRERKDLIQLSSSLGGAFSLPVAFGVAIATTTSIPNYFFVASVAVLAFLVNMMSAMLVASGARKNRTLLYYNFAFLTQMLFSSSIFVEYLYGSYAIITILPEIAVAALLYMKFFHRKLSEI